MASVVTYGVAVARSHWLLTGVWALGAFVLAVALSIAIATDAARVAPSLSAVMIGGTALGLLAIALSALSSQRARP